MSTIIRRAVPEDAATFVQIKDQLPLKLSDGSSTKGGFLLGTDLKTYRDYIQNAYCLVAATEQGVVGFGILLPDHLLRESEVWKKRRSAAWFEVGGQLGLTLGNRLLCISELCVARSIGRHCSRIERIAFCREIGL